MTTVQQALDGCADWKEPRVVAGTVFRLSCRLSAPAGRAEIAGAWRGRSLPPDLVDLWQTCREADLFVDIDYGQRGLRLLSPAASRARTALEQVQRPGDFGPGDIVVGGVPRRSRLARRG